MPSLGARIDASHELASGARSARAGWNALRYALQRLAGCGFLGNTLSRRSKNGENCERDVRVSMLDRRTKVDRFNAKIFLSYSSS